MNTPIKTIFMGTPNFAVPGLEALINDTRFDVDLVITQPDKKIGRKQIITPPPIKSLAIKNNIKVLQADKISELNINFSDYDLIVVIAFGQILPENILNAPKYGCINVHGSLLPKYRGAACVQAAILNGETESGITIMKMDKGLDTGPIIKQNKITLANNETAVSLHDKLANLSANILCDALFDFIQGKLKAVDQDNTKASYIGLLKKQDGRIDWSLPAIKIERMIRAFNPWPGTYSQITDKNNQTKNLKILETENTVLNINNHNIGEIFLHDNQIAIQCGENAIIIKKLQLEGKKPIQANEFIGAYPDYIGKILI